MRPYMLWLTRVYAGRSRGYGTAFLHWPNVLDDWLRRCAEDRFRSESYPRLERFPPTTRRDLARHSNTTTGNPRLVEHLRAARDRARAAEQGER